MDTGYAEDVAEDIPYYIAIVYIHIARYRPKVGGRRNLFFSTNHLSANDCDAVKIWRHVNRMKTKMRPIIMATRKLDLAAKANISARKVNKWRLSQSSDLDVNAHADTAEVKIGTRMNLRSLAPIMKLGDVDYSSTVALNRPDTSAAAVTRAP